MRRIRAIAATAACLAVGAGYPAGALAGAQAPAGVPAPAGAPSATPAPAAPQAAALPDSVLEARTTAIASELRCPVCQGLSIQDSPSELAQQMRSVVKQQVALGKSDEEVRSYFLASYGEWILLAPRPRGFNLLAYLLPAALLIGGALVVARNVRRWTGPAVEAAAPGEPAAD